MTGRVYLKIMSYSYCKFTKIENWVTQNYLGQWLNGCLPAKGYFYIFNFFILFFNIRKSFKALKLKKIPGCKSLVAKINNLQQIHKGSIMVATAGNISRD